MSFTINGGPGALVAAQIMTHYKGQEAQKQASTDEKEKQRIGRMIFQLNKNDDQLKKADGAQKGLLA